MNIEQQALELAEIRRKASEASTSGDIDTYLDLIVPQATGLLKGYKMRCLGVLFML